MITYPDDVYSEAETKALWDKTDFKYRLRTDRTNYPEISQITPDGYYIALDGDKIIAHCGWVKRGDVYQTTGTRVEKPYRLRQKTDIGIATTLMEKRQEVFGDNLAMSFLNNAAPRWINKLLSMGWERVTREDLPERFQRESFPDDYIILLYNKPKDDIGKMEINSDWWSILRC